MNYKSNIIYIALLLICITACQTPSDTKISTEQSAKIDQLIERYHDLGRYSGAVMVAQDGDIIYEHHAGLADYEDQVPFTSKTAFKVSREKMYEAFGQSAIKSPSHDPKNIATGYLYHNYRGQGLEREESPKSDDAKVITVTTRDILKMIDSAAKDVDIDGYIEDDGFSYSIVHDDSSDQAVIILSNRRHPVAREMSTSILSILDGADNTLPLPREPIDLQASDLEGFPGHYAINSNVAFDVVASRDSLFVLMGPNKIHIVPQSAEQFYMEDRDASMRFVADSAGVYSRIVLLNGFIDSDEEAARMVE